MPAIPNTALEDIDPQGDSLHRLLAAAVHDLRADGTFSTSKIIAADFTGIIRKATGLWVEMSIDPNIGINAYVMIPKMDKNHVFYHDVYKPWTESTEATAVIHAIGKPLLGSVDLRNCKVEGSYTQVKAPMVIGAQLLRSNKFTDGEVAAIMLHEIGHLFTYFQFIGTYVRTALISAATAKGAMGIEDATERAKLIREGAKILGLEKTDAEALAALPKESINNAIQTVFLTESVIQNRSENGDSDYELRACEQLADQFATRHGASRDLVTGLDRLWRVYNVNSTISSAMHVFIEIMKLTLIIVSLIGIPSMALYILLANPMQKIYDDPGQRIRFIKQQLIVELKSEKTTDPRRQSIVDDIAAIQVVEDQLTDRLSFIEWMIIALRPSVRRALRAETAQKQIETLANNDLFVQAAKFQGGV